MGQGMKYLFGFQVGVTLADVLLVQNPVTWGYLEEGLVAFWVGGTMFWTYRVYRSRRVR